MARTTRIPFFLVSWTLVAATVAQAASVSAPCEPRKQEESKQEEWDYEAFEKMSRQEQNAFRKSLSPAARKSFNAGLPKWRNGQKAKEAFEAAMASGRQAMASGELVAAVQSFSRAVAQIDQARRLGVTLPGDPHYFLAEIELRKYVDPPEETESASDPNAYLRSFEHLLDGLAADIGPWKKDFGPDGSERAVSEFRSVIEAGYAAGEDPQVDRLPLLRRLTRSLLAEKRDDVAVVVSRRLVSSSGSSSDRLDLHVLEQRVGAARASAEVFVQVMRDEEADAETRSLASYYLAEFQLGEFAKTSERYFYLGAFESVLAGLELDAQLWEKRFAASESTFSISEFVPVIRDCRAAGSELAPVSIEAWKQLATWLAASERPALAVEASSKSVTLAGRSAPAQLEHLLFKNRVEDLFPKPGEFEKIVSSSRPGSKAHREALYHQGMAHVSSAMSFAESGPGGHASRAEKCFRTLIGSEPKNAKARLGLAMALLRTPDLDGAKAAVEQAVALGLSDAEAWLGVALVRSQLNESELAHAAVEEVERLVGDASLAWRSYADLMLRGNHAKESLYGLRRSAEAAGTDEGLWHLVGVRSSLLKEHEQAAEAFRKVIELGRATPASWTVLAEEYRALGDVPQADSAFEAALGLDPNDKATWRSIRLLAQQGDGDPKAAAAAAIAKVEALVERYGDTSAARCEVAFVHGLQSDVEAAATQYALAYELSNVPLTKTVTTPHS